VRVLLDTHLLLWALASPSKMPAAASRMINDEDIYVSAASIWEISIKISLGKMRGDPREVIEALDPAGFRSLPITHEHAARVLVLPPIHKDPFDRMLVAQALSEPMILLTNDAALAGYGDLITVV
jgi:PIN domain nuclease of toxin-antitoxin system